MNWALLIMYILWWGFFGIIHSLTTSISIKNRIPIGAKTYRVLYNIIAIITFMVTSYNVPGIGDLIVKGLRLEGIYLIFFLTGLVIGTIIAILGLLKWDLLGFIGITKEEEPLNTSGIYSFSRHPVYLGAIIIFIATLFVEVSENSLSWIIGAGGYFLIGTYYEEKKLAEFFDTYKEYQRNVGRLFPTSIRQMRYFINNV